MKSQETTISRAGRQQIFWKIKQAVVLFKEGIIKVSSVARYTIALACRPTAIKSTQMYILSNSA